MSDLNTRDGVLKTVILHTKSNTRGDKNAFLFRSIKCDCGSEHDFQPTKKEYVFIMGLQFFFIELD